MTGVPSGPEKLRRPDGVENFKMVSRNASGFAAVWGDETLPKRPNNSHEVERHRGSSAAYART